MPLVLPWPPSVNHYWRRSKLGGMHISDEGRAYRKTVCALLARHKGVAGRVSVRIDAYPPDRRARDLDNLLKSLIDAMQHAGVYENDSKIDSLCITRCAVRKPGEVRVWVEPWG